ncbi:coiled-coil domain-containing protein 141 [Stegastes partitus]|uniref:Coiled-coil domain-containing protein 141 n=1 Tax=Stegastes partitus TaxID=144197 RepID=A0A9Y4N9V5_9TELE|nr:PREDICTED: coiled-coil domain-containing protein 141 [Stegastes partitus]
MTASLSEGWALLIHLLHRKQEVLLTAAEFHRRALEFSVSISRLEELQLSPADSLTEVQLRFDAMRRDVLGKSLQVLTCISILQQKLQQLQRTEALQRTGGVLQDEEDEEVKKLCSRMNVSLVEVTESSHSSQYSSGAALRLDQLVETLQDRRRSAEQAVRLQLQLAANQGESRRTGSEPGSRPETRDKESAFELQLRSRSEETKDQQRESRSDLKLDFQSGSSSDLKPSSDVQPGGGSDLEPESISVETRKLKPGSGSEDTRDLKPESRSEETKDFQIASTSVLKSRSSSDVHPESRCDLKPGLKWEDRYLQLGSEDEEFSEETDQNRPAAAANTTSGQMAELQRMLGKDNISGEDSAHHILLTNRRLLSLFKHLVEKVRGLLSNGCEGGRRLSEAEHTLDTHLYTQAQVHTLDTHLYTQAQVEQEMEVYRKQLEEEVRLSSRSPEKKEVASCWDETLTRLIAVQELGNSCIHAIATESDLTFNQSLVLVMKQTMKRLDDTKRDVKQLKNQKLKQNQDHNHNQDQNQNQKQNQKQLEDEKICRKYEDRLRKTLQDLLCVSDLLDSCSRVDLGSDLQTSKLLRSFMEAKPHFSQLDADVQQLVSSWEVLRVQNQLEVTEEDVKELLKLQQIVKDKIQQSESILELSRSFQLTAAQLEALMNSEGCSLAEQNPRIQNLMETSWLLKNHICSAVAHTGAPGFHLQQLQLRLVDLDSRFVSWKNEAAQRDERRQLIGLLHDDIIQLRDSFKELKKRFSNVKFNYLKRNDRTRNMKAVRNQLQQVELFDDKLQALRKRLHGSAARLGSEVKDGGVAREVEDAANELQRQMGEFDRSVSEHKKTLDMTCRLQEAMEEYQFWCEEASATIARVGKFSSECRSTEAVSVLYRQFEKFIWPTVPQQEERISQISELAVRLHGVEEGRRYIEKTVSKHSEMVESIRELSDGLMELEVKLKTGHLLIPDRHILTHSTHQDQSQNQGQNLFYCSVDW